MKQSIPKYALRFLRWYCNPDYLEDLEGDITERFCKHNEQGLNARLLFFFDVLRLFRPGLIRPFSLGARWVNGDMMRHHFLIGKRVILGDKTYAIVSIFGLGLGFAAALYLLTFTQQQNSFDTFHKNHQSIYRITTGYSRADEPVRTLATSPPSLTGIIQRMPEVKNVVRIFQYMWDLTLMAGDVKYRETRSLFVEPHFLDVFDFQLIQGDPKTCLSSIRSIVLTESLATKYFGTEDPMGKNMKIDGASSSYEITGIIKDPPLKSHIQFDFLVSYETIDWWWEGEAKESWNPHEFYTYVQLIGAANPKVFETKLNQLYMADQGAELAVNGYTQYFDTQKLASIHLYSNLENELLPELQGNGRLVQVLTGIAWLILVIGWINYINLSTAKTFSRNNEVTVRRKIGASGNQLTGQFLVEAALVSCLAIIFGLLVLTLFVDQLAELTGAFIAIPTIWDQSSFIYPVIFMLFGAVFSGWYHSKGITRLKPLNKSSFNSSNRQNSYSGRILIVLQFVTSIALIVCTTIVYYQLDYISKADLGFDLNDVVVIKGPNHTDEDSDSLINNHYNQFIDGLQKQSGVINVTSGATTPGERIYDAIPVRLSDNSRKNAQSFNYTWVGYDFFSTFNIVILAGRSFDPALDNYSSIMINTSAATKLGFDNPNDAVGAQLVIGSKAKRIVVGVYQDFRQESIHREISPMVIDLSLAPVIYFAFKHEGTNRSVIEAAEYLFAELYPRDPFDYYFLDEFYNRQYAKDQQVASISSLFSGLAIIISCLGLFGMTSFNVVQRTKEIGIRKVLGADLIGIIRLLSTEYVLLVLVSCIVALPLSSILMKEWLNVFSEHIDINALLLILPGIFVLLLAFLTTSLIVIRVANANPINSLRSE